MEISQEERELLTHQAHCCVVHGCKYGEEDCPVVTRKVVQKYPCHDCSNTDKANQVLNDFLLFVDHSIKGGHIDENTTVKEFAEYIKTIQRVYIPIMKEIEQVKL